MATPLHTLQEEGEKAMRKPLLQNRGQGVLCSRQKMDIN